MSGDIEAIRARLAELPPAPWAVGTFVGDIEDAQDATDAALAPPASP